MSAFEERLKTFMPMMLGAEPLKLDANGAPPAGMDLRVPHLLTNNGKPCGLASGLVASTLVSNMESNRILHAVGSLLADLVEAPPDEIPLRLKALIEAHDFIVRHLDQALTATEDSIAQMRASSFPHTEWKRRTH